MGTSLSLQTKELDYAEECVSKGIVARDRHNFKSAQRWFEEALRIREPILAPSARANYNEAYISILVLLGEIHFWRQDLERSLFYLVKASDLLDPKMDMPSIRRTTAVTQFVNLTAGLVLVYNRLATDEQVYASQEGVELRRILGAAHPLDMAEGQLNRAIEVVTKIEGSRSSTLISLLHMLARVQMARGKAIAALRVMQRCLGLTLHVAQTKQIFSFLSYTRNVLDAIKKHALKDAAAITIQQWWRERKLICFRATTSTPATVQRAVRVESSPAMRRTFTGGIVRTSSGPLNFTVSSAKAYNRDDEMLAPRTARTEGSESPPALPHDTQRSGSFHQEGHNDFGLPDILGMRPDNETPTPTTVTNSVQREQLPGEIDDVHEQGSGYYSAREHTAVYSSLSHVQRSITASMKLWEIPPDDEEPKPAPVMSPR
jgi:hypothetical protein